MNLYEDGPDWLLPTIGTAAVIAALMCAGTALSWWLQ